MKPLIDVVIPVHGRGDWLRVCLAALLSFRSVAINVVLVDNATPANDEATQDVFNEAVGGDVLGIPYSVTVIRLPANRSFSEAVNVGVKSGTAPNVFVLNSDAIVQPGWDSQILADLSNDRIGLTGFRSNFASGLQGAGGLADLFEPKFLVFLAVAFRREVYEKVGSLDGETFDGFSCEDIDYSFRVRDAGYKLLVSKGYVHHGGSQTLESTVGDENARARNDAKYQARLEAKHGKKRVDDELRRDPSPRILVASMSPTDMTHIPFVESLMSVRMQGLNGLGVKLQYTHVRRQLVHTARDQVLKFAIKQNYTHVWFVDDDMTFQPDTLLRLLQARKSIVGAWAYTRKAPYVPCVFEWNEDLGRRVEGSKKRFAWGDCMIGQEHTGVRKVDCIGFSCVLLEVEALRKIDAFQKSEREKAGRLTNGQTDGEIALKLKDKPTDLRWRDDSFFGYFQHVGEDFYFCALAEAAGVPVHCDTDLIIGHLGDAVVVDEAVAKGARS